MESNKRSKKYSSEKAITLVALIITIIVMLILVGVSIQIVISSNLIPIAENGSNEMKEAYKEESNMTNLTLELHKEIIAFKEYKAEDWTPRTYNAYRVAIYEADLLLDENSENVEEYRNAYEKIVDARNGLTEMGELSDAEFRSAKFKYVRVVSGKQQILVTTSTEEIGELEIYDEKGYLIDISAYLLEGERENNPGVIYAQYKFVVEGKGNRKFTVYAKDLEGLYMPDCVKVSTICI